MKKWHVLVLLFLGIAFALPAQGAPLPDAIDEWEGSSMQITEFDTASEDLGRWLNQIYIRKSPIASVEVNLTEGPGPGSLRVPEDAAEKNDAPLGFSSTYRTLNVAGKRAILERGEATGQALAVALDKNRTLTVETKSVSEEELLDFAERLVAALETE